MNIFAEGGEAKPLIDEKKPKLSKTDA